MPPAPVKNEIKISSEAFDELTGALNEKGIKLDNDSSFTVTKDTAIVGPINYRQVNLRHQLLIEVVKVYKTPVHNEFEVSDSSHFINFFEDIYNYVLKGDKPTPTPKPTLVQNTPTKWK